jgi:hypothetical protein
MKTCLPIIALLCILNSNAQERSIEPTCAIKKAGHYLVELAGCTNYIDIYLYDLKEKPVRGLELKGKAEFFYLDETCASSDFIQYERSNALRAEIPGPGFYNFKVSLIIRSDTISTYFDNTCDLRAEIRK